MPWPVLRFDREQEVLLPRSKVWELLGNTDHLNRVIGLPPVLPGAAQMRDGQLFRDASAQMLRIIRMRWREYPTDWVKDERFTMLRRYESGPFRLLELSVTLADGSGRLADGSLATHVKIRLSFQPSGPLGYLMARLSGARGVGLMIKFLEDYRAMQKSGRPEMIPQDRHTYDVRTERLDHLLRQVAANPIETAYLPVLREHLMTQGDDEVTGMRPFRLAQRWQTDPLQTLRLFLYAAKEGVLTLNWNMLCPMCRVSQEDVPSLTSIPEAVHCDLCGINFQVDFDRYVELTFDVHPAIRTAVRAVYCLSGPALSPHILQQHYVEQGDNGHFIMPNTPDDLRLRVLRFNHTLPLTEQFQSVDGSLTYTDQGFSAAALLRPAPGEQICCLNQSGQGVVFVLERLQWDPLAVTAARVTAMQEFRSLFSSEVLAPGQEVGIASVTLLFSDLRGSTAMYEAEGDSSAYSKVRRHFDFMVDWIARYNGSLVKTIGDSVMAVFYAPEEGVRAALEVQRHLAEFNAALGITADPIVIKMGLHHGPAIAINANGRLDYFGRTVNIAARVQGESKGNDLVISQETYLQPGVQEVIERFGATTAGYRATLRGIQGPVEVVRLQIGMQ